MSGLGNDSLKCRTVLEALSPNINVMRHPNKLLGGSTAILWSHHEKLVIIDRYMNISNYHISSYISNTHFYLYIIAQQRLLVE